MARRRPLALSFSGPKLVRAEPGWSSRKRVGKWLSRGENRVFVALLVVHLVPLWIFRYFPSQDGPSHLANANIIREYGTREYGILREYYLLNPILTPNWFWHLILSGFESILPTHVAEATFLSAYVILVPVSLRYAISSVANRSEFLAIVAFPFIYNYLFHMGFYSFAYSLPLFLFVSGYLIRHMSNCRTRHLVVLSMLMVLLYLSHIVSLVVACLEVTILVIYPVGVRVVGQRRLPQLAAQPLAGRDSRPAYVLGLTLLPAIGLWLIFASQLNASDASTVSWLGRPSLPAILAQLASLYSLVSYDAREVWLSLMLAIVLVGAAAWVLVAQWLGRISTTNNALLAVAIMSALVTIAAPESVTGGAYIRERLILFPYVILILWLAFYPLHWFIKESIQWTAVVTGIGLLLIHVSNYAQIEPYIDEYLSARNLIQEQTTVLPIYFSQRGDVAGGSGLSLRVNPFASTAGYIAIDRHVVDLNNYEAGQRNYFPVVFWPDLNPGTHLIFEPDAPATEEVDGSHDLDLLWQPARFEISTYQDQTRGRVDYVLLWGIRELQRAKQTTRSIFRQLEQGYDLIYTSPRSGLMQLYRRKDLLPAVHG
jgi:hypothetical protein